MEQVMDQVFNFYVFYFVAFLFFLVGSVFYMGRFHEESEIVIANRATYICAFAWATSAVLMLAPVVLVLTSFI